MKKVIWFIRGAATQEQKEKARLSGFTIRDASQVRAGDFIEVCDAVFGDVPAAYAEKYPNVDDKAERVIEAVSQIADVPKKRGRPAKSDEVVENPNESE